MDSIPESLPGAIAGVLIALITVLAARGTQKSARQAGEDAHRIDQGVVSTEALIALVGGYETRMHDLEDRTGKTEKDLNALGVKHRAAIRYINAWRTHASALSALLARHAPDELLPLPPAVPAELVDDLREE